MRYETTEANKMKRFFSGAEGRYVPKGAVVIRSKNSSAVAYLHDVAGAAYAVGYVGKSAKPAINFRYKSPERRLQHVAEWMQGCDASEAYRANRKAEKAEKMSKPQEFLKVGDCLSSSWGYDQTNVDFYQVVELFGKRGVVIRKIGGETVTNNDARYCSDRCKPVKDAFLEKEPAMRKQVNESGSVKVGHHYASKTDWDKSHYYSWGH